MKLDVYICACAILVSARNGAPSARLRPASCLRRKPIARMHGQHPSGPDFVFTRAFEFKITAHQPSTACEGSTTGP